jgi:hypothetical protein
MFNFLLGVLTVLFIREVSAYLPTIGRSQINRGIEQLPSDAMRLDFGGKWLAVEAKLPGDLSKLIWGIGCNWLLAQGATKPARPERVTKLLHFVFFIVYLKVQLGDFIKLNFASPRTMMSRWVFLKMIADQSLAVDDPSRPQPLLTLAGNLKDEKSKQTLLAMVEAMRAAHRAARDETAAPAMTCL